MRLNEAGEWVPDDRPDPGPMVVFRRHPGKHRCRFNVDVTTEHDKAAGNRVKICGRCEAIQVRAI